MSWDAARRSTVMQRKQKNDLRLVLAGTLYVVLCLTLTKLDRDDKAEQKAVAAQPGTTTITQELHALAANINKQRGSMLDKSTRFDGVSIEPNDTSLTYAYTVVTLEASKMAPANVAQLRKNLEDLIRENACQEDLKPLRDANVTLWYRYSDPTGQTLAQRWYDADRCARESQTAAAAK